VLAAAAFPVAPAGARPDPALTGGITATSHPRVVLLGLTDDDPLAARLAAELEGMGLDVERARIDPTIAIDEQVRVALTGGARGVVVADGRRTEFWVAEEGTDRIAMRQELEIEFSPTMESVLSLRTVEFLRASLGLTARSTPAPPVTPPPVETPAEDDARVALGVAAGVVGSTGRVPPFAAAGASVRVRLVGPLGIEVRGLASLMPQQVQSSDGPVDTSVWLGGGGLVLAPRLAGRATFEIGAGAMAATVWASGTNAGAMSTGRSGHTVGLAFYGRAAGRVRISPSWSVRLDILGGTTAARRPVIVILRVPEETVTAWGVGFVAATAGVEWGF
jgi:hypothetical protein